MKKFVTIINKFQEKQVDKNGNYKFFIIIEMEAGLCTLNDLIKLRMKTSHFYSEKETIYILLNISKALWKAQKNKISHNDVKPHNILFFENGVYQIFDFDISIFESDNEILISKPIGSVYYLSPELKSFFEKYQKEEETLDILYSPFKSDVYSLGILTLKLMGLSVQERENLKLKNNEEISVALNSYQNSYPNLIPLINNMLSMASYQRKSFKEIKMFCKKL